MVALLKPHAQAMIATGLQIVEQDLLLSAPAVDHLLLVIHQQRFHFPDLHAGLNPALNFANAVYFIFVEQAMTAVGTLGFQ